MTAAPLLQLLAVTTARPAPSSPPFKPIAPLDIFSPGLICVLVGLVLVVVLVALINNTIRGGPSKRLGGRWTPPWNAPRHGRPTQPRMQPQYRPSRPPVHSSPSPPPLSAMPYKPCQSLLTPTERTFFAALTRAAASDCLIFAKVCLRDVVYLPRNADNYMSWFGKISQQHLDFVLCDRIAVRPFLVIELDDRSHQRADRIERDASKDAVLHQVGLVVVRVPVAQGYDVAQLRATIDRAARSTAAAV